MQQQQNRYLKNSRTNQSRNVLPLFHRQEIPSWCPVPVKTGQNWPSQQGASTCSPWQPASDVVVPHTQQYLLSASHYKTNTRAVLGQRLLQLIITLTHNYRPGHKNKHGSDPTAYIKKKVPQLVLLFYFELYIMNFQLSLQCDSEIISSIFMALHNKTCTTTFLPASLPTRDCVQNWNKQLSSGEINGTYTSKQQSLWRIVGTRQTSCATLCARVRRLLRLARKECF